MSDDDLDALFDEIDVEDPAIDALATEDSSIISSIPSENENRLQKELQDMKLKMAEMQALLQIQSKSQDKENQLESKSKSCTREFTPVRKNIHDPTQSSCITTLKSETVDVNSSAIISLKSTTLSTSYSSSTTHLKPKPTLSDAFNMDLNKSDTKLPKKNPVHTSNSPHGVKSVKVETNDAKADKCPHSGIRITNRTVAKSDFNCAVATRRFIKISSLPLHFKDKQDVPGDWLTTGVIVRKAGPYKSSTGNDYSIWTLSDLISLENKISLFLFKDSHVEHRKETVGTVVAILNANFMPPRDQEKGKKTDIAFSLDNSKKLLRMGMSTDYGTCKNVTKGGQSCSNYINKALTQFCDFHIIKVHTQMRNKRMVLNTSYTPQPKTEKFEKQRQDCQAFLHKGNVYYPDVKSTSDRLALKKTDSSEVIALKKKGMVISTPLVSPVEFKNRLKMQTAGSMQLKRSLEEEKEKLLEESSSKRPKNNLISSKAFFKKHIEKPSLGHGAGSGSFVDLNCRGQKAIVKAKALALAKRGDFAPVTTSGKRSKMTAEERKRMKERSLGIEKCTNNAPQEVLNGPSDMLYHKPIEPRRKIDPFKSKQDSVLPKTTAATPKRAILSAAFGIIDADSAEGKRVFKAQSMNSGVLKEKEIEKTTEYFSALEKFEHNENKLMDIKEMKITVYICGICSSTTQKQLPKCVEEGHPVRKGPSVKRFFKCEHCQQRTDVIGLPYPDHGCGKCGKISWKKCSMYHEKKGPKLESEKLVVRVEDVGALDQFK